MKRYIYIAAGGFLGAILRWALKQAVAGTLFSLPAGTLLVNITGCFMFVFITVLSTSLLSLDADLLGGMTTGFLGAYTTFSALSKEMIQLLEQGHPVVSVLYAALSVILGLASAAAGGLTARKISACRKKHADAQSR